MRLDNLGMAAVGAFLERATADPGAVMLQKRIEETWSFAEGTPHLGPGPGDRPAVPFESFSPLHLISRVAEAFPILVDGKGHGVLPGSAGMLGLLPCFPGSPFMVPQMR